MSNIMEFFGYENDKPIEIQLEPEAITFIATPAKSLRFVAVNCQVDFRWSLRIDHARQGIQLFPDTLNHYEIEIYENDQLLKDW